MCLCVCVCVFVVVFFCVFQGSFCEYKKQVGFCTEAADFMHRLQGFRGIVCQGGGLTIYIHLHLCRYVYVYVGIVTFVYVFVYTYSDVYENICKHTDTSMCMCVYACINTYIDTRVCIYIYIYLYLFMYIHTRTCKCMCEHLPVSRVVMYSISLLVCFACMYRACRSATYWIKRRLESYRSYRSLKSATSPIL